MIEVESSDIIGRALPTDHEHRALLRSLMGDIVAMRTSDDTEEEGTSIATYGPFATFDYVGVSDADVGWGNLGYHEENYLDLLEKEQSS